MDEETNGIWVRIPKGDTVLKAQMQAAPIKWTTLQKVSDATQKV